MLARTLPDEDWTARQGEVLEAALGLLVEEGATLTTAGVARAASCSKETLYKWFGDRDGLLTAIVRWQAAKVKLPRIDRERLDAASLREGITSFARNLLGVLSSDTSVALNRLAISHGGTGLGAIVLENGRREMGRRLKPVLEAGRDAKLLRFDASETAFRTYFGLVVRDVQIRLLLGEDCRFGGAEIAADAERATDQFFALYGADEMQALPAEQNA
ncbi:MAG: TetR/AcrR family transcriptional regulator C-terminal domain-containing protein [Hyphomicrobiaceae bacterium]|nr:TetR/AcrR family transcriptional regulator C-terminal domain-containing protein [Hyphomicrobiaceae bacterium]MCC0024739.1 TetR/AcrR family transcriptional regulator C-terminal domain-containing protein [Hyphomicrobiaceae bacterium]